MGSRGAQRREHGPVAAQGDNQIARLELSSGRDLAAAATADRDLNDREAVLFSPPLEDLERPLDRSRRMHDDRDPLRWGMGSHVRDPSQRSVRDRDGRAPLSRAGGLRRVASMPLRSVWVRLALASALAMSLVLMTATASQAKFTIKKCGRASYAGEKVPVSAHKLSCKRAKKIARHFLKTDDAPSGWKVGNLAGCEWQFAPEGGSLYRWRVNIVRENGCED